MKVRGPFRLPNRPTWYVDIGRKRKSLGTADEAEAKRMVKDIARWSMKTKPLRSSRPEGLFFCVWALSGTISGVCYA
jgi:hypothetical protein